ncbi:MAG: membrane protein insertase YidC [Flavobacteriales bacterium]|nr:membrane protein insertase YidC [Flavobacteriales bacterium]
MDKNSLIGFVLIGAILIGWTYWMAPNEAEIKAARAKQDSIAQAEQAIQNKIDSELPSETTSLKVAADTLVLTDSIVDIELANAYGRFSNASVGTEEIYTVENEKFELKISSLGGRMISARLKDFKTYDKEPLYLFDKDSSRFFFQLKSENRILNTSDFYFVPSQSKLNVTGDGSSSFKLKMVSNDPNKFIEYVYTLKGDAYDLNFAVNVVGLDDIAMDNNNQLKLFWSMKSPSKEKGWETEDRKTTMFYKPVEDSHDYIGETKSERYDMEANLEWVSFKQQFFSVAILAKTPLVGAGSFLETVKCTENGPYTKELIASVGVPLNNNNGGFDIFLGPNDVNVLNDYGIEDQIDLGWGIFGWVSEWFLIPIFTLLSNLNISYGWIILILTLLIKLILSPITYKSYLSGAKMKVLKPEIEEINKKFKDADPMKKQQETMALYNKAGANPMAGCIPMLLQMPILYAMFMLFPALIQLRGESFLWAEDLSTFDSVWNFGYNIPFYGSHVSLFTLLMAGSMFFYTKSNMSAGTMGGGGGNEAQMKQMQIMMLYVMPVMMLVWFNNYPAGLSYYYLCANLTSILQNWVFRKYLVDEDAVRAMVQKNKEKPKKKSKFQAKLEEMAKAQEQKAKSNRKK